jgi:hypothetical protein
MAWQWADNASLLNKKYLSKYMDCDKSLIIECSMSYFSHFLYWAEAETLYWAGACFFITPNFN